MSSFRNAGSIYKKKCPSYKASQTPSRHRTTHCCGAAASDTACPCTVWSRMQNIAPLAGRTPGPDTPVNSRQTCHRACQQPPDLSLRLSTVIRSVTSVSVDSCHTVASNKETTESRHRAVSNTGSITRYYIPRNRA